MTRKKMSNMSDSSFYKFQKKVQEKMQKFTADTDREVRLKSLKQRFSENTGKSKLTLWQKIKGYFYVKKI